MKRHFYIKLAAIFIVVYVLILFSGIAPDFDGIPFVFAIVGSVIFIPFALYLDKKEKTSLSQKQLFISRTITTLITFAIIAGLGIFCTMLLLGFIGSAIRG